MSGGRDGLIFGAIPNGASDGLEAFRHELLAGLPGLLDKAIRDYQHFTIDCPPDDAKGFVAYQAGCRAALAHIHLLVKLAQWARSGGIDEGSPSEVEHLDRLVHEAEVALRNEAIDED